MPDFQGFVDKLKAIKAMGYVRTHRLGNTGIGKTLEDLLGIRENNAPGPDNELFELKSARKNSASLLTLFTKSPLPPSANSVLLRRFGYPSRRGNGRKELHTTVNAITYNTLRGKPGFKIAVTKEKVALISTDREELGYWDKTTLKSCFERKYPSLTYVKADSRGEGLNEEFWFNEAYFLSDFSFNKFVELIKKGTILVDVRIGQYPSGKPHDHGTGFRVMPDKLDSCFEKKRTLI